MDEIIVRARTTGIGKVEMGSVQPAEPVMMFCAVFAQQGEAMDWAEQKMVEAWGPVALKSPRFQFVETHYYQQEMGDDLQKQLLVFESLQPPEWLPGAKLQTNQWEEEYLAKGHASVERPVNIDPGYLTLAKLVLATTKDRDHRLYLGQGIFGEVTVHYKRGQWQNDRWTYPDFQREDYHQFLDECRERLKSIRKSAAAS